MQKAKLIVYFIFLVFTCSNCKKESSTSVNPYGDGNGKISFYTTKAVFGTFNISLKNTSTGVVTNLSDNIYWPTGAPGCDNKNVKSAILPAGNYQVTITNSSITGTCTNSITLASGQCLIQDYTICGGAGSSIIPSSSAGRTNDVQGTIYVKSKNVLFKVWDSGTIDEDIISLGVNGSWVLQGYTLTATKKSINATLNGGGYSYVLLYAHNVGSIAPNTAAVSVWDGFTEQTLVLSADLSTNGAYNIVVQP
jgi:hypothetical protein